jgi:triacylglycerol lipase
MFMNNYPIILAHGIARFDALSNFVITRFRIISLDLSEPFDGIHYFKGMRTFLRSKGFNVEHAKVSFAASVETRADDLQAEIERILKDGQKVHIIAHSMGGLDSRHLIFNNKNDIAKRIASLTTIGTPHWGSSFANWVIENKGDVIEDFDKLIPLDGIADLTIEACRKFNEQAEKSEAANDVFYQTYSSYEDERLIFEPLKFSCRKIFETEKENDGLVAKTSQSWTDKLIGDGVTKIVHQKEFSISADHLNEVGWWDINQLNQKHPWIPTFLYSWWYERQIKNIYLEIAERLYQLSA